MRSVGTRACSSRAPSWFCDAIAEAVKRVSANEDAPLMGLVRADGACGRSFELVEPSAASSADFASLSDLGDALVLIKRIDGGAHPAGVASAQPASGVREPLALALPVGGVERVDVEEDAACVVSSTAAGPATAARSLRSRILGLGLSRARRSGASPAPVSPRRLAFVSPSHVLVQGAGRSGASLGSQTDDAPLRSACAVPGVDGTRRPRVRGSVVPSAIPENLGRTLAARPAARQSSTAVRAGGGCCSSGSSGAVPHAPAALPSTAPAKKRCSGCCAKCRERKRAQESARAAPQQASQQVPAARADDLGEKASALASSVETTALLEDNAGPELLVERFNAARASPAGLSPRAAAFLCSPPSLDATEGDAAATTKHWGVVVQARSAGAATAEGCYILKTSRGSPSGGVAATHFSLTRVARGKGLEAAFTRGWLA